MEIGSKLKEARMRTEFTQEQVAEAIGVSRQTISNWENENIFDGFNLMGYHIMNSLRDTDAQLIVELE